MIAGINARCRRRDRAMAFCGFLLAGTFSVVVLADD
jgi:hypothetical protein